MQPESELRDFRAMIRTNRALHRGPYDAQGKESENELAGVGEDAPDRFEIVRYGVVLGKLRVKRPRKANNQEPVARHHEAFERQHGFEHAVEVLYRIKQ